MACWQWEGGLWGEVAALQAAWGGARQGRRQCLQQQLKVQGQQRQCLQWQQQQ